MSNTKNNMCQTLKVPKIFEVQNIFFDIFLDQMIRIQQIIRSKMILVTKTEKIVVKLARLQDIKKCSNSHVRPRYGNSQNNKPIMS